MKAMLGIQLRRKRTNLVPIRRVRNIDRSCALNAPRLLVRLFDEQFVRIRKGLHLLHVTAKVAYLYSAFHEAIRTVTSPVTSGMVIVT